MDFRARVNNLAGQHPGAELTHPWDENHDAWKVGGKMFACMGAKLPGVSVKTDSVETAAMLIDAGVATKAPYFHRSWILLPADCEPDELRHRIQVSYDLIRAGLTKKAQAALEAV